MTIASLLMSATCLHTFMTSRELSLTEKSVLSSLVILAFVAGYHLPRIMCGLRLHNWRMGAAPHPRHPRILRRWKCLWCATRKEIWW